MGVKTKKTGQGHEKRTNKSKNKERRGARKGVEEMCFATWGGGICTLFCDIGEGLTTLPAFATLGT